MKKTIENLVSVHRYVSQPDGRGLGQAPETGCGRAYSAGIQKHGLDPMAVNVMREVKVDIGRQVSKTVDELPAAARSGD